MLLQFLYFIVGLYLLICILLYFFQDRLIFFPQKLAVDHTFNFVGDFEEKFFQVDDKTMVHALHFFSKNPKGVILYFHGNAGALDDWGEVADDFVKMDYDVLISDFRGFGKSTGEMTEANFNQDAQMFYDFLLEKYDASEIIIYGRSLGTGVAVDLASKNKAQQLILETPFANFADLAQNRFKIFPVKALLKFSFSNKDKIGKVDYPIHIFHGTNDEVIPYHHAKELESELKPTSTFTTIEFGSHNNISTFQEYWTKIKAILK
ncbi:MAG: alpha/beta hydrolase [Saprospiraceae bacterium]